MDWLGRQAILAKEKKIGSKACNSAYVFSKKTIR